MTGLRLRTCSLDRARALAMFVSTRAFARGEPLPFVRTPVVIELDDAQRREIADAFGVSLERLIIDVDAARPAYSENWESAPQHALIGRRCEVIVGGAPSTDARRVTIRLAAQPGDTAFGTGEHPATRLALENLEEVLSVGDSVIDVGTGSGILAIAAARLGASSVTAFDIDRDATRLARRNVAINEVSDIVTVRTGELQARAASAAVVVANLISGDIVTLMPAFARVLVPGGRLVVSGVVIAREDTVRQAAEACSLTPGVAARDDPWVSLAFSKDSR